MLDSKMHSNITQIFQILKKQIPIAHTELEYEDEYTLLVSVVLSAQATDKQVNKVTARLFDVASTPQAMIDLGLENLTQLIKSVNLFNNKAKNILGLSQMLIERFNSKVPNTREELMQLPGVGRKSADVMLNIVHKKPTIAVDTHVARLSQRLQFVSVSDRDKIADILERLLPQHLDYNTLVVAHHLMVLHARYVCTARKPKCEICTIKEYCPYYKLSTGNS